MQENLDRNLCLGAHSLQNSQACGALKQSSAKARLAPRCWPRALLLGSRSMLVMDLAASSAESSVVDDL